MDPSWSMKQDQFRSRHKLPCDKFANQYFSDHNLSGGVDFMLSETISSYYDQWNALTRDERDYFYENPADIWAVRDSKNAAIAETTRRFGANGRNDRSDAFRHCYWSALLARELGATQALAYTTAHESSLTNPPTEKQMDSHNNRVGIGIGRYGGADAEISERCFRALIANELRHLR